MKNIFGFVRLLFSGYLVAVLYLFTTTNPLLAQWVQSYGPYGGFVNSLAVSDTNLYAGTYGGGVFLSTNNGASWTQTGLRNTNVYALDVSGTNLFAGTVGDGV